MRMPVSGINRFRAAWSAYLIWGGLISLLLSLALFARLARGPIGDSILTSIWLPVGALIAVGAFILASLIRFRIVITPEEISYRTLIGGERKMRFEEMKSVRTELGFSRYKDRILNRPFHRIIITDRISKNIIINAKLMKPRDIKLIIEKLKGSINNKKS